MTGFDESTIGQDELTDIESPETQPRDLTSAQFRCTVNSTFPPAATDEPQPRELTNIYMLRRTNRATRGAVRII